MPRIDQVVQMCQRLAPLGWADLFARVGLDIRAQDLASELSKSLPNIRQANVAGFADFHPGGTRAVEPGQPARSLLYHVLASPAVHPTQDGSPSANADVYPTLDELDSLENYIYAVANRSAADFPGAVVVVFACQYRTAARTAHGLFADTAYSRTGIARVGTAAARYDPGRRSFWPMPDDGGAAILAMPSRYCAYLAVSRKPGPADSLLGGTIDAMDANRQYLIPVHKLFSGSDCLSGLDLDVQFQEFHRNEKLRRVHTSGNIPPLPGFDLDAPPFVRDSVNSVGAFLTLQKTGDGSTLVVPTPHPQLVRTATQHRATTGRDEIVRFVVPASTNGNRFGSSYDIQPPGQGRQAPEYVNIRHRVQTDAAGTQTVDDINLLAQQEFDDLIANGGYESAHYIDDSCDGCVSVTVAGLPAPLGDAANVRPAYSLVTAPDFFPLMDQIAIFDWATHLPGGRRTQFRQGSPEPLARGRTASNPTITRPAAATPAFDRDDLTMTAVLCTGSLATPGTPTHKAAPLPDLSVSFLPDAASNVFAPGWDVSLGEDQAGVFHTSYGLGSPFPEDAKLCAALNSFWPAAAPDATRTFGLTTGAPTAQPLLDVELGLHPSHPRVRSGAAIAVRGWDGEFGPFLEPVGGQTVANFATIDRSDYVSNALAGLITLKPLIAVTAEEMIRRMEALRACVRVLPPAGDQVSTTALFLISAERVEDWAADPERSVPQLAGPGLKYTFVTLNGPRQPVADAPRRTRQAIQAQFDCQVAMNGPVPAGLAVRQNGGNFTFHANP